MKKEIINHLLYWLSYFVFLTIANSLYSFKFWPLYVGGLVGMLLPYVDHLLYIFVFKPYELTSQRVNVLVKNKEYKEALVLLHDTCTERKDLIFHTLQFQIVFAILTFWVVSSSGNLFARGLVLAYFLCLTLFNLKKFLKGELILENKDSTRIYFTVQVLALFIFALLL